MERSGEPRPQLQACISDLKQEPHAQVEAHRLAAQEATDRLAADSVQRKALARKEFGALRSAIVASSTKLEGVGCRRQTTPPHTATAEPPPGGDKVATGVPGSVGTVGVTTPLRTPMDLLSSPPPGLGDDAICPGGTTNEGEPIRIGGSTAGIRAADKADHKHKRRRRSRSNSSSPFV